MEISEVSYSRAYSSLDFSKFNWDDIPCLFGESEFVGNLGFTSTDGEASIK
jgi:hypothetical protein